MHIYVKEPSLKIPISIPIPNALLFSRSACRLIYQNMESKGNVSLSEEELYSIMKEVKCILHNFGHFNLIHVESEDGTIVDIDI